MTPVLLEVVKACDVVLAEERGRFYIIRMRQMTSSIGNDASGTLSAV
jgi:hypothetical protein